MELTVGHVEIKCEHEPAEPGWATGSGPAARYYPGCLDLRDAGDDVPFLRDALEAGRAHAQWTGHNVTVEATYLFGEDDAKPALQRARANYHDFGLDRRS